MGWGGQLREVSLPVKRLGYHFEPSSSEFSSVVFNFNAIEKKSSQVYCSKLYNYDEQDSSSIHKNALKKELLNDTDL